MDKKKPFWELGLNPITMLKHKRYSNENRKKSFTDVYPKITTEVNRKLNQKSDYQD